MQRITAIAILALGLLLAGCGQKTTTTQALAYGGFTKLPQPQKVGLSVYKECKITRKLKTACVPLSDVKQLIAKSKYQQLLLTNYEEQIDTYTALHSKPKALSTSSGWKFWRAPREE